jgi:hypothetical protein
MNNEQTMKLMQKDLDIRVEELDRMIKKEEHALLVEGSTKRRRSSGRSS